MASELHVYVDDHDCDKVVASSPEDALDVWFYTIGELREDYPDKRFTQVPDDARLRISYREMSACAPEVTMTARLWARESGRGFLCSTEF